VLAARGLGFLHEYRRDPVRQRAQVPGHDIRCHARPGQRRLAALAFVFIGNAVSGGTVPFAFLPDGFRQVAPWLPNGAIVSAARRNGRPRSTRRRARHTCGGGSHSGRQRRSRWLPRLTLVIMIRA
jgi:hypothetical protein